MRSIRLMAATTVILFGAWGCGDDNGGGVEPGTDPVANFTAPACTAGTACTFTDASTDDGTITAWSWDFNGDGTPDATTATASFTYPAAGTFQVTLTVTDNDGNTDSHTAPVTVTGGTTNAPPTAAFNVPTTCVVNVPCLFTDASTDSDGTIAGWNWAFGDGGTDATQNPSHTYTTAGNFDVTLTVTDNLGATGTTTQPVTISPASSQSCTTTGTFVDCTLTLTQRSTVAVTLTSAECELGGNRLDVRDPLSARQVLFFNGCFLSPGTQFLVDDATGAPIVFEANTTLVLQFRQGTGTPAPGAPAAQLTGTFPGWELRIDDGGNPGAPGEPDFTDLVLAVTATPQ